MASHRRRLPHWHPEGASLFVTFRLANSLPPNRWFGLSSITSGRAFVTMDRLLDSARIGPFYLRKPEIARLVAESIQRGAAEFAHYHLHAFAVMPNHTHMLITPRTDLAKLMQSLKGATARKANRIMGTTGERFWQDEYFDHWVRTRDQFARIVRYIEYNPAQAGLCREPEEYPWSSARMQLSQRPTVRVSS